jgi:hypothetical protein
LTDRRNLRSSGAVLSLVVAAALAAAPIDVPLGGSAVPLRVDLEVRTGAGRTAPTLGWATRPDGGLTATAAGPEFDAEIRLEPVGPGMAALAVRLGWRAATGVEHAGVRLSWPGPPRAIGRDLSFAAPHRPVRISRGTPLLVAAGALVVAGGPGVSAARIAPAPSAAGETEVELLLDDAAERPFSTYEACLDRLPAPASPGGQIQFAAFEERRREHPLAPRRPGDVDEARASLYAVVPGAPVLPVIVERWPRGARAAVVFTDHADRTDAGALRAVLWGRSDAAGGERGFLGRGVRLTRTFFVQARHGSLADPAVRALADELAAHGSEVALHSITPDRDERAAVRAGLAAAAPWRPATWIDHEPYTNCEALSSEGWRSEGRFAIRDLLAPAGIRWAWAAGDLAGGARIVNVLGGDPASPRAPIYPLTADPRVWLFRSSLFYASPAELGAALSDEALAALERERGLFVAHTYLGAGPEETHGNSHLARLAVRAMPGGLELAPELDAALVRIAARARAGTLASLTWAEAGDRLRALGDVEVTYLPDGAAEVRNHGATSIEGLTVAIPADGIDLTADGAPVLGRADVPGACRAFFDLPPGARVVLHARSSVAPVPFLPLASPPP